MQIFLEIPRLKTSKHLCNDRYRVCHLTWSVSRRVLIKWTSQGIYSSSNAVTVSSSGG
jgi:hypothetical protein